ncbi:hypothetical protein M885DRAFT_520413 [Pelagophyceae sp. CCMP2097]|nr:hypothetical protein M885DRAFT_520413 [Pelagophyceae sp. CCMP2097]
MGAGASCESVPPQQVDGSGVEPSGKKVAKAPDLARLRRLLYIKAFNAKAPGTTIDDLFSAYKRTNAAGETVLRRDDIKRAIGLTAPWFDDLLRAYAPAPPPGAAQGAPDEVRFDYFVDFLSKGSVPPASKPCPDAAPAEDALPPLPESPSKKRVSPPLLFEQYVAADGSTDDGLGNGEVHEPDDDLASTASGAVDPASGAADRQFGRHLFPHATAGRRASEAAPPPRSPEKFAIVPHRGTALACAESFAVRRGPQKPLWRKREVVLQERIVVYTTVDAAGAVQELVETERTSTEVVHMECKETGEFAHRETSNYEQSETFNAQVVAERRGAEEYYHLKSLEDEVEFMESNGMPGREPEATPGGGEPAGFAEDANDPAQQAYDADDPDANFDPNYNPNDPNYDPNYDPNADRSFSGYVDGVYAHEGAPSGGGDGVWVPHGDDGAPDFDADAPAADGADDVARRRAAAFFQPRPRDDAAPRGADAAYFAAAERAQRRGGAEQNFDSASLQNVDGSLHGDLPHTTSNLSLLCDGPAWPHQHILDEALQPVPVEPPQQT